MHLGTGETCFARSRSSDGAATREGDRILLCSVARAGSRAARSCAGERSAPHGADREPASPRAARTALCEHGAAGVRATTYGQLAIAVDALPPADRRARFHARPDPAADGRRSQRRGGRARARGDRRGSGRSAGRRRGGRLPQLLQAVHSTVPIGLIVDASAARALAAATPEALAALRPIALDAASAEPQLIPRAPASAPARACAAGAAGILFTSGSSGQPKGVRIGASDLLARAECEVRCFELHEDDRLLGVLPFSSSTSGSTSSTRACSSGATLHLSPAWLPRRHGAARRARAR